MNVSELLTKLSYGELSNTALAVDGQGTIQEEQQPKVINYANEALIRLYSRFCLREKDVLVEMVSHITNYHLNSRFAETKYDPEVEPYPYIKDLPREPFADDVIKVLTVYDSFGSRLALNDAECPTSVFTPQANVLQVPFPVEGACLSVHYQAMHPILSEKEPKGEIQLPFVLDGALTAYIAYKVYSHMNTQEASAKAQEHLAIYEQIANSVTESDTATTSIAETNTRFHKRGWI
jgi:hypothetical protein